MPEGDSIHRLTTRLSRQLVGVGIAEAQARTSRLDASQLVGLTFREIEPLGKHILMRLGDRKLLTLHSHLRMQGRWTVLGEGKHLPRTVAQDARLLLKLDDGRTAAAINMPVLEIVDTKDEQSIVGHVGPDVLADDFKLSDGAQRLANDTGRASIEALLDQRNVSGLGNLWVVEVLFLRGVHPDTPIETIDLEAALALARKMMLYSRDVVPGMITTGDRRKGKTHWVYGRANQPCLRCGTPIKFRNGDGSAYRRETWWCPNCQPLS